MNKEETQELEELSLKVFGKRYEWRKLRKRGINVGKEGNGIRRMPLTVEGAKHYMNETLRIREQILKDMEKNKDEKK